MSIRDWAHLGIVLGKRVGSSSFLLASTYTLSVTSYVYSQLG